MRSWTSSPSRYRQPSRHRVGLCEARCRPRRAQSSAPARRCAHDGAPVDGDRSTRRDVGDRDDRVEQPDGRELQQPRRAAATVAGASPPTTPAARPHIVSGAASGTAIRLAGSATSGIDPNTGMSTGRDADLRGGGDRRAPRASSAGPRSRAVIGRASSAMPRLARARQARIPPSAAGTGRRAAAPSPRARARGARRSGRPRNAGRRGRSIAIAIARSTDGSQRVIVPNSTSTASATPTRPRSDRVAGAAARTARARTRRSRPTPR